MKAVIHDDGSIWIGNTTGQSWGALQVLVQGCLTAHYCECMTCVGGEVIHLLQQKGILAATALQLYHSNDCHTIGMR